MTRIFPAIPSARNGLTGFLALALTFFGLAGIAHGQSAPVTISEDTAFLRLAVEDSRAAQLRLEVFNVKTGEALYDTGPRSGRVLEIPLDGEIKAIFASASIRTELRAWDAAGDLLLSQLSTLPKATTSEILSISFDVIPPGVKMVSNPIGLLGDTDIGGDLNIAGALQVDILQDRAGGAFFGTCPAGTSIRAIDAMGNVTCEADNIGGGDNLGNHRVSGDLLFDPQEGLLVDLSDGSGARFTTGHLGGTWFAQAGAPGRHRFGVRAYYDNSGADFVVDEDGNVGIFNFNPTYPLDINGQARATAWLTSSSAFMKENIRPLDRASETIRQLRGVTFQWKAGHGGGDDIGFIGEEIGAILPELVDWDEDGKTAIGIDEMGLLPVIIEALKEQMELIERQRERLNRLEMLFKALDR